MKSFETLRTWLIVIGLLLFSGVASLGWIALSDSGTGAFFDINQALNVDIGMPVETETELVTIQLDQYLLGEVLVEAPLIQRLDGVQVHPLLLAALLAAFIVGGIVGMGLPLAFIYVRLDRETEATKEDPEFQEKRQTLEQREKEELKERNERQPAGDIPSHEMPRWRKISTSLVILFFVILIGLALSDTFVPEGEVRVGNTFLDPAVLVSGALALVTALVLAVYYSRGADVAFDAGDDAEIPWGTIWVVISGLIFVGIGTGIMLVIRGAGG